MTLAVREPSSLVEVFDRCTAIEQWASECESIAELKEESNLCAAMDEYLARTSAEGRARVAATIRRLEVRIGQLLPERTPGRRNDLEPLPREAEVLNHGQRRDFRQMADHPEVVEEVIAESTDEKPASRRTVMQRLQDAAKKHPVDPPAFKSRAAIEARVAKAKQMAEEGFTSRQIAAEIGIAVESMSEFRNRHGITVPADTAVGSTRRHDSNRILDETVTTLEAVAMSLNVIEIDQLDASQAEHWVASLTDSIRSLNRFTKKLKETTL
jgi:hypothetical protein